MPINPEYEGIVTLRPYPNGAESELAAAIVPVPRFEMPAPGRGGSHRRPWSSLWQRRSSNALEWKRFRWRSRFRRCARCSSPVSEGLYQHCVRRESAASESAQLKAARLGAWVRGPAQAAPLTSTHRMGSTLD